MALPPFAVRAQAPPPRPATGGHYVRTAPGVYTQIHATGPGKWAPGPPKVKAPTPAAKPRPTANPYNTALYQPSQTLSGKPLAQYAQAVTNLKYDPTISDLSQQIGQNTRQGAAAQQATAGYFNQLGQYATDSANRVGATAQGLNATLQGIGQGTQSALDQFGQRAAAPALGQLAAQGLGGGAPEQLAAALASQKLLAGQNAASDQSYGAKIGANATTLADQSLGTYALRGQERLGQIAAATRLAQKPIETKLATTKADKRSAYVANLLAARQQQVSNDVTQAGLNIKKTAAQTAAQTAAFNTNPNAPGSPANARVQAGKTAAGRLTLAQQQADPARVGSQAWQRVQNSNGTAWSRDINAVGSPAWARARKSSAGGAGGGAKPLSTLENDHFWGTIGQIEQLVKDGQAAGGSEQQIRASLADGTNPSLKLFDPFQVRVAYELLGYNGKIDSSTAAILNRQYGARGGTYNGRPITVTQPAAKQTPLGAGLGALSGISLF